MDFGLDCPSQDIRKKCILKNCFESIKLPQLTLSQALKELSSASFIKDEEQVQKIEQCPEEEITFDSPNNVKIENLILVKPELECEYQNAQVNAEISAKIEQFQCDKCVKKFNLKKDLVEHVFEEHRSGKKLVCEFCGKTFKWKGHLNLHVKITHQNIKDFTCYQCHILFGRKDKLTEHIETIHRNMNFTCCECNKSFRTRFDLNKHGKRVHQNIKDFA